MPPELSTLTRSGAAGVTDICRVFKKKKPQEKGPDVTDESETGTG